MRPISMIRWMGGLGQSSDPDGDTFDADGLPLSDGLVEVITDQTTVSGERHAHLRDHVGEVAVLACVGDSSDPETEIGGVDWIRAVDWVPYQSPTFVTPSFAAYVSGHSAFSRASAEVLTAITGSEFFSGGLGECRLDPDPVFDCTVLCSDRNTIAQFRNPSTLDSGNQAPMGYPASADIISDFLL